MRKQGRSRVPDRYARFCGRSAGEPIVSLLPDGVPGMARIQSEIDRSQVVTAKCSEPQVVNSDVEDGGSGVAILSSVRTETGYKAKWWIRLLNKPKSKR